MTDDDSDSGTPSDLGALSDFVERLTRLTQESGLISLEIKTADIKVRIQGSGGATAAAEVPLAMASAPLFVDAPVEELTGSIITAPMVGTYYHSTSPSDPPLVQVGDRVEVGQVIGIIEAMKIMNEIVSDRNGLVVEIIVPNGAAVEYGSLLVRIAP